MHIGNIRRYNSGKLEPFHSLDDVEELLVRTVVKFIVGYLASSLTTYLQEVQNYARECKIACRNFRQVRSATW
jgi:hypothetical protein